MAKVVYTGVNNIARKVKNIYVGVNGTARKVKKAYVGVNNVARLCYSSSYMWAKYNLNITGSKYNLTYGGDYDNIVNASSSYISPIGYISNSNNPLTIYNSDINPCYIFGYVSEWYSNFSITNWYLIYSVSYYSNAYQLNGYTYSNFTCDDIICVAYCYRSYSAGISLTCYVTTKIEDITEQGSFIEYVTSDNPSAYPDNGAQGGYWYIKQ